MPSFVPPYLPHPSIARPTTPLQKRCPPSLALSDSGPRQRPGQPRFRPPPPQPPPAALPGPDYNAWSSEFLHLCDAQLQLLITTVPRIAQALLFFRRENPSTGALEFVPLVVHTRAGDDRSRRVWISKPDAPRDTHLEQPEAAAHALPGGIPAQWILPDYPFKAVGQQGGILMPDGGLCIPIEYNGVLAGSVVLCPDIPPVPPRQPVPWDIEDIRRADMVAKSISLAAALEGKWQQSAATLDTGRSLIDSMRTLLRTTLHQVRSPVSALVTFGHLLLRKLPPGDANRALAKNIILESLRVDDLLKPLDQAGADHVLSEASDASTPWSQTEHASEHKPQFSAELSAQDYKPASNPPRYTNRLRTDGVQLLWLSDVLDPQVQISSLLATEEQIIFHTDIDDDTPPVMAVEKYVREAVSNLVDNSFKYSPPGSHVGICCWCDDHDEAALGSSETGGDVVQVIVWDTGYGFPESEQDDIWEFGFRGSAAVLTGSPGSGIGLFTVRDMLEASGAEIILQSPLPSYLDPREPSTSESKATPGSAFFLRFRRPAQ